jgi:serine/threonine-protein kinase
MIAPPAPDPDHLRKVNALLEAALALPDDERATWLRTLPPEHQSLVPLLTAMLSRAGVETDGFMREPVGVRLEDVDALDAPADRPGDTVGPYRLISELGAGGMATVWLAERTDGVLHRHVALKLPREGWASGLAQRMARERDILGALEHPRIARLYDAGVSRSGRPWMAMECVSGIPIDAYAREQRLEVPQRLRLFLQVLAAVAHAHARLIVHRDLKPNNILVTESGEACLLDFGVAKLLGDGAHEGAGLTQLIGRAITPDYASPEQIANRPVTVATDVYSLGVVLYELLTGERPYRIAGKSATALEEAILAVDVPAASARVADRALALKLRGDLDTILAKALQKNPAARYSSAEALTADLQRHLNGEPVLAQAPTRVYRAAKFVRRNRIALATASAVATAIVGGSGVAWWQARVARAEAARAEQVKDFIASIFQKAAVPREGAGGTITAEDLLDSAAQRIESELASQPRVAAELGMMVGEGFSALGVPAKGSAALRAAVTRADQVYGRRHPLTLRTRLLLSESVNTQDVAAAERLVNEIIPDALAGLPDTAEIAVEALSGQSFVLAKRELAEPAYAALRQAIAIGEKHLGPLHQVTIHNIGFLANTYGRFGERAQQLKHATEALARAQQVYGDKRPHTYLIPIERWYGEALRGNERPADAEPVLRRVLQDQRALDTTDTLRVRNAMQQLATTLDSMGRLDEGLALMRQAVAMEAAHHPLDSDDRSAYLFSLASALTTARLGDEALALVDRVAAIDAALGHNNPRRSLSLGARRAQLLAMRGDAAAAARVADDVAAGAGDAFAAQRAEAWVAAAINARLQRRNDDALVLAQRVVNDARASTFRSDLRAVAAAELGHALIAKGDLVRAEQFLLQSRELYERAQVVPSVRMNECLIGLARVQLMTGRAPAAEALLRPLVSDWERLNPGSVWHGEALYWLSRATAIAGDARAAATQRDSALAMLRPSSLPAFRELASR